ncbi:MAG: hypothetical protein R6X22_02165 [Gemmatimonadota bacterium]
MRLSSAPFRRPIVATAVLVAGLPGALRGQDVDRDARVPAHGEIWVEFTPSNERWHEQFALDSDRVADGAREPLLAGFDGPIAGRLFPGLDPLLADLNRDALALGWDSLSAGELRLGSLTIGSIDREIRRVPLGISLGLFDRIAVDLLVPLVRGRVEPFFAFEPTSADWVAAPSALASPAGFFGPFGAARADLASLIAGGTLTPEQEAEARALLENSETFAAALERRWDEGALLPVGSSPAGSDLLQTWGGFAAAYEGFGLSLPELSLAGSATAGDLQALLGAPPIGGDTLRKTVRGWALGEIEVGLRVKLIDTFGPVPVVDEEDFRRTREPDLRGSGVRFRTTAGGRLRLPVSEPDAEPYLVSSSFLQQPIGDGQTDVELGVWQDVQVGRLWWLVGSLRFVWQLEDELTVRIAGPGAPFAYAAQERAVSRDLGDRLELRLSPRVRVNDGLSLGIEYLFERKGEDIYAAEGAPDPAPLSLETEMRRHRFGIGAWYRTTPRVAAGIAGIPVEIAFVWQASVAGSGGATPASSLVTAGLRVPIRPF